MYMIKRFFQDESGAVTVDWVVLTSGIVIVAVIATPPISEALFGVTEDIGETIESYDRFLK